MNARCCGDSSLTHPPPSLHCFFLCTQACRNKGLLVITAGKGDIVRLVPPLVVTAAEVDQAVAILAEAIKALP